MTTVNSRVDQGPSVTAGQIAAELAKYNSPLLPYAQRIYDDGKNANVDPAFFLGTTWEENGYCTAPNSACSTNYNYASISNAAYGGHAVSGSRWGQYPSPQAGIDAFFKWIPAEYYPKGQNTIYTMWWGIGGSPTVTGQHAMAPASENPPDSINRVVDAMNRAARNPNAPVPKEPGSGLLRGKGGHLIILGLLAVVGLAALED